MKLLDYIKSNRRGKDAHHIERLAMEDPFLADALDGLDSVEGDHVKQIEALQKRFNKKVKPKTHYFRIWSIAASILICVSIGGVYIFQNIHIFDQFAIKTNTEEPVYSSEEQEIAYISETDTLYLYMPEREMPTMEMKRERKRLPSIDYLEKIQASTSPTIISETDARSKEISPSLIVMEDEISQKQYEEVTVVGYGNNTKAKLTGNVAQSESASQPAKELPNIKPSPVMGTKAYQNYIKENMKRPTDGVCGEKKGTVVLEFYVDSNGTPVNISIKKGVCVSMDIEAIRLLQQGPKWTVGSRITELKIKF